MILWFEAGNFLVSSIQVFKDVERCCISYRRTGMFTDMPHLVFQKWCDDMRLTNGMYCSLRECKCCKFFNIKAKVKHCRAKVRWSDALVVHKPFGLWNNVGELYQTTGNTVIASVSIWGQMVKWHFWAKVKWWDGLAVHPYCVVR